MNNLKNAPAEASARDFGADAVRIFAGTMVLVLHFFLRNGFYYREMNSVWGLLAITVRSVALCCIPLFLMLTGYLKCRKKWSLQYYASLIPLLLSYTLISLLHLLYKTLYRRERLRAAELLLQFLGFELANYSWYVGVYLVLFLLSPLLNLIWQSCQTEKAHRYVLLTMIGITFLPASINRFVRADVNLLPACFTQLYYVSYYFIGAYIRTYRPKIAPPGLRSLSLLLCAGIAVLNVLTRTDPANFYSGFSASYDHLLTAALSCCLFLRLYALDCPKPAVRKTAAQISGIMFEIYLCSYIPDTLIYPTFPQASPVYMYFPVGLLMVTAVFVLSAALAYPVNRVSRFLSGFIVKRFAEPL